jgi:hypothetical protein
MDCRKEKIVEPGGRVSLSKIDPGHTGKHVSEESALPEIQKCLDKIRRLQYSLYAEKKHTPWHIIPSSQKWFRNLAVSQIVSARLEHLEMQMPQPQVDLAVIRRAYQQAAEEQAEKETKGRTKREKKKK